jgi:DNA-binding transcriptional ArsR family regulator
VTDEETASLRATAHPLRLRMLSLLTGSAMSAAEVARELDITHANASYHLRVLLDADLVEVDSEERIRGGVAKRYRYRIDREGPVVSKEDLVAEVAAMSGEMVRRIAQQTRGRSTFTDAELWLAEDTWSEVVDLLGQASHLMHREAKPPRTPGAIKANLSVAAFRMESGS